MSMHSYVLAVMMVVVSTAGCGLLQAPPQPDMPSPGHAVWESRQAREHISFLSSSGVAQRAIGTPAMEQAAEYVASRMRGYALQPWIETHRVDYPARAHRISSAEFWAVAADSVQLQIAHDFWPDGRSDSGRVHVAELHLAPDTPASPISTTRSGMPAVVIDGTHARRSRLDSLAAAGFRAAFIVQPLTPVAAVEPVPGLLIAQITPGTAAWLLGLTRPGFDILWQDPGPTVRSMARRIDLRIGAATERDISGSNVLGMLAGREPLLMRDLVIVAANLDAAGVTAGERVTDFRQIGTGLSAMLEIARNEQRVARRFTHPMRTVMFAAFSGNRTGHQGLQHFLRRPMWEQGRIRTLIYLGLSEEDEVAVREIVEPFGIELVVVRSSVMLPFERRYVFASERGARSRSRIPRIDAPPTSPESGQVNSRALEVALDLAQAGFEVLQHHAGAAPLGTSPSIHNPSR
jgi:hypothetical protein